MNNILKLVFVELSVTYQYPIFTCRNYLYNLRLTYPFLTINVRNANKFKDGYYNKRIRCCIGVHKLQHVHPTLKLKTNSY